MEGVDLTPDSVISFLIRQREVERKNSIDREKRDAIERHNQIAELQSLSDQQAQIKENINKNLKSLLAQKHGLQKVVQGSECKTPKLPVTHKYQRDAVNFVTDAINFVNNYPDIEKSVEPENDVDTLKLCHEINTCGEAVNQELTRSKTRVNQVVTLRENTEIIKNHCFVPCDDDRGLIEDD